MRTANEIGQMALDGNVDELRQLLAKYGYKDEHGYRITIVFPNGDRLPEYLTSYGLAPMSIASLAEGYNGCNFLIKSMYEDLESGIAFWANIPGTYKLPIKPSRAPWEEDEHDRY